ncbi:hypothetical protein M0R45_028801 [Rubus argutus]|uniref:Bifunctional inhibitor/plant lipid transfer protein/seed storage helical domain-containing protein n=1 Tax=Rubus argutus TaxID=59490 RepID=A0AAW1W6M1_RUBAR
MASSGVLKVVCVVALLMAALFLCGVKASVQCRHLADDLQPCTPYVQNGGVPEEMCCNGIKTIYNRGQTTRQDIANCLRQLNNDANTQTIPLALGLPDRCGIVG